MVRYAIKHSRYSSHAVIPRILGHGHGRALLDVGCARGELASRFADLGWVVTGIEPDLEDAEAARRHGISVLQLPLNEALEQLPAHYSAVVLADVLEHVADPWQQLAAVVEHCRPDARVIVSLPNIAHLVPRLRLLGGGFEYEDRGIMDRTHLRFFTQRTALDLVTCAGLVVESVTFTPTPVELVFPGLESQRGGRALLSLNARLASVLPRLLAYQFVMECRMPNPASEAR
jgi:2-polyprenyl-3-methyl-5-hydroxy-6-metoxy-1,4-benzoquinol methylase